ncbi:MAG: patatin-like phospholipase family protein [Hyphomicrobiales bacterium]
MTIHQTIAKETATPHCASGANVKTINLALQGGGAHGAFTWGVLDRLLEEPGLDFEGVVATSAGAMNAAVMTYGLIEGGRDGAKRALANFWRRVSHAAVFSPLQPTLLDRMLNNRSLEASPAYVMFDMMTRVMSPYQFNPLNINPLRRVLEQSMDFEVLRSARCRLKLHLCATNVRTGKVKVFTNDHITCDSVMASACLPFLFRAVEIDGEAYWDGGYMGNPAIFPLIYHCESPDVLIVHINPMMRPELPKTATDIMNRVNEISFNSSLMREMRAIEFVTKLIDSGMADELKLKRMLIHAISADDLMVKLGVASKLNADWSFLVDLRDAGRAQAEAWLAANYGQIGKASTVDIHAAYL